MKIWLAIPALNGWPFKAGIANQDNLKNWHHIGHYKPQTEYLDTIKATT